MLKKGLKNTAAPVEDIFEAWRDYLQELDDLLSCPETTSFAKDAEPEDIFKSWRKNNIDCGQPTVKSATMKVKNSIITLKALTPNSKDVKKAKKARRPRKYEIETIFASWRRHELDDDENVNLRMKPYVSNFSAENFFSAWRHNLVESTEVRMIADKVDVMPEVYFHDWRHNLFVHNPTRPGSLKKKKNQDKKQVAEQEDNNDQQQQSPPAASLKNKSRQHSQRRSKKHRDF